jgi:integrase
VNKTALIEKYAENLSKSDNSKYYLKYATDFLMHSPNLSRESIENYMDSLRTKGHKPGTVNLVFRIIRRLYNVNDLPWEYRQGEAPAIGQRDEYRPQLSPEIIQMMVTAAKTGKLKNGEACFLALSTTYGLRREEMANLKSGDLQLNNKAIYIATIKFGRERYHLVPREIDKYLAGHNFEEEISVGILSHMFKRILKKSGAGQLNSQKIGWHSIRRAVFDGLVNGGVNPLAARTFLRWKGATGQMAMPARYYGNVVIGLKEQKPMLEEAKGDEEVFEKHPFLPFWRD